MQTKLQNIWDRTIQYTPRPQRGLAQRWSNVGDLSSRDAVLTANIYRHATADCLQNTPKRQLNWS